MAHKMRKFSAGGAQGRYDRRMADIEKDYKIALAKGKNEGVAKAKYEQRKADAEDDRAKRTGADRTATRAAEKASEAALKEARRTKGMSITKRDMTNDFKKYFADKPMTAKAAKPAAETPKAKPQTTRQEFNAAFSAARAKAIKEGRDPNKETFMFGGKKKVALMAGEGRKAPASTTTTAAKNPPASTTTTAAKNPPAAATTPKATAAATAAKNPPAAKVESGPSTKRGLNPDSIAGRIASSKLFTTSDAFKKSQEAKYGKAKGGSVKKEITMNKKPMPMKKKPMPKEPITGGANTVPLTPERKEFLKELAKRNAKPGMAKGGKATKFGAAMVKKSADTKGRAMMKFAKGGSIDGCAVKGKTKTSMVKMKKGGSC
jgi:hypothetical protein